MAFEILLEKSGCVNRYSSSVCDCKFPPNLVPLNILRKEVYVVSKQNTDVSSSITPHFQVIKGSFSF